MSGEWAEAAPDVLVPKKVALELNLEGKVALSWDNRMRMGPSQGNSRCQGPEACKQGNDRSEEHARLCDRDAWRASSEVFLCPTGT